MFGLGIFRKKQTVSLEQDEEVQQVIFDLIDKSTIPLSGNSIHRLSQLGATDIDECLQRLVSKGWIEVVYSKTGLDSIVRPFYRVTEKYNLMDVRAKVSSFITGVVRKAKPLVTNDHSYHVTVKDHKQFDMNFDVREDARQYKRLLKTSRMKLEAEIWEQIFEEGVQVKEMKIS